MIRMNSCHKGVCVPLLLCGTGIIFPAPSQAQTYTIVDLGTLGGTQSEADALNNLGQVVGASRPTGDGNRHAFLWSDGAMTDLGTCGGSAAIAIGINDSGMIVGESDGIGGAAASAFLIDSNGCTILPELSAHTTQAYDINDSGVIVGFSNPAPQNRKAVRWVNQVIEQLSTPGNGVANSINSTGDICGFSGSGQVAVACIWNSAGVRTDLPGLGGAYAHAADISDSGWVVGQATNASAQYRAFLWTPAGGTVDLGTLGGSTSDAIAVNSSAVITGTAATSTGAAHAFVWHSACGMRDLNDLLINGAGWELSSGQDINNNGQIVGIGMINGQTHGFLLNPTGAPLCVPTLSEWGLMAMAGLMLAAGAVVIQRRRGVFRGMKV